MLCCWVDCDIVWAVLMQHVCVCVVCVVVVGLYLCCIDDDVMFVV